MSERGGLKTRTDTSEVGAPDEAVVHGAGPTEYELAGPDRAKEHSALYVVLFLLLAGGSVLLRSPEGWSSGPSLHTIMEAVATILAFIVGALALVRYYSRKQVTFLLIGCGFLGAAVLDLNHVVGTLPAILEARTLADSRIQPDGLYAWTWTAGRVFLSLFLFVSLLAWRQEVKEGREEMIPEISVIVTALVLTVSNLLFFDYVPLAEVASPLPWISRPSEFVPAIFFALAFVGFYRKGSWRRDQFEHWMLVSLILSVVTHGVFMAFSEHRFDAMFDAAHLLKIMSYIAILTGLLSSVYTTFTREAQVLAALTHSNDALAREVQVRTATEHAVSESSQRLQSFLDNANDLIQSVDREGRFLYVNRSWKRVLGYSDADLDRMRLLDIAHPRHRDALDAELRRVLAGGEPQRFNTEYVASDGRLVILSGSAQVQSIDGSAVTQSILRDVTEQRLAERRLDESQRNLEALVENTGDSIWSVDREHRLITLNSAFSLAIEARTGREPQVGEFPTDVFAPEDVEWYEQLYARTLAGERHSDRRNDQVDGQIRSFEVFANPIQSLDGVSGAVFFGKDVTGRVRAEEALRVAKDEAEAANKAKSDFLANMSHELRTPLNSVIGFTNILLKNKEDRLTDKDMGFLQRVLSNGKHLLALINEVLDLAKVEAGRMELIIEDVDLADLCVETVQQLEGQARSKGSGVVLQADVPDSVELVETDSAKLKQVIINLVGNALKFTHEGSVTVRLEMDADGRTPTAIAVQDTGIGIPADRLEAIFEAFQQAEAGTSRKYGGTGLGLALSRSICLLMGYDLIVESTFGEGSTFRIVMGARAERPVRDDQDDTTEEPSSSQVPDENTIAFRDAAQESDAESQQRTEVASGPLDGLELTLVPVNGAGGSAPVRSGSNGAGRAQSVGADGATRSRLPDRSGPEGEPRPTWNDFKVLVVDDERDSRVLAAHFLEDFGCQVFTASSGEEGLELARRIRPDLMTLDLIMPGVSGWEVLRRMKADHELRGIPVVVLSVVANEGRGRLLGAVDLVTKPFDREDLLRVLWRNLGRRRGGRVLLMVAEEERRAALSEVVQERGLEVVAGGSGDLMATLAQEAPDAVVLDLTFPRMNMLAELLHLRDDRVQTGLPVLVMTHPELNDRERSIVTELATVHASSTDSARALERLLDASFPLAGAPG